MPRSRGIFTAQLRVFGVLALGALAAAVLLAAGPATAAAPLAHASAAHHKRHHRRHHRRHHHRHHGVHAAGQAAQASTRARTASATTASSPQTAAVPTPPCAGADTPATQAAVQQMRLAVECLVNQERTSRGLPALADDSKLTTSAQNWTDHMVASGEFTHGTNFSGRVSAVGYDWQGAGENIATGYDTPRDVVLAWMASPEHCQNILDPTYTGMGTGLNTAPVGSYASQPSTWTQDFGLLMSQNAPSHNDGPMNGCPYNA